MDQSDSHPERRIDLLAAEEEGQGRCKPWLGVYFRCAHAYVRVFRNKAGTGYLARCPRCARPVRFSVGPHGIEERWFEVSC